MNKIPKNFSIKNISKENISAFQKLVRYHWPKKKHVFSKSKNLINFYYNYSSKKKTNLIGLYKKNKLVAAMGLIPNKNWDHSRPI